MPETETAAPVGAQRSAVSEVHGQRPDIQGLRAIAVLAVIADHLAHKPPGGFVGVDVFFVISGFLITGQLLRDARRPGGISFRAFYAKRIRRILPAACVTLVVVTVAAAVLLAPSRAGSIAVDGVAAAAAAANWRFGLAGVDYFTATGPVSPLQHFWSLAVEEQFYVVWPWMILGILMLSTRRGHTSAVIARLVGGTMAAIIVLSLGWAFWETRTAPSVAYFSTFSRAWELGAGALLAILAPRITIRDGLRPLLAWAGLALIGTSLLVISAESPFPAPWALVPVLGTVLVVAAGIGGPVRRLWPLTNPVSRYLGDISYSLYLWHFPVIVFADALTPEIGRPFFALVLGATTLLAIASFHLVEEPVRRSSWLLPTVRRSEGRTPLSRRVIVGAAVVAAIGCLAFYGTQRMPGLSVDDVALRIDGEGGPIAAALVATTWPDTAPSLPEQASSPAIDEAALACAQPGPLDLASCSWGDGERIAVVVGDSTATAYVPGLRAAVESTPGWRLVQMSMNGCPFSSFTASNPVEEIVAACPGHNEDVSAAIAGLKPELVISTGSYYPYRDTETGDVLTADAFAAVTTARLDSLDASRIVRLAPPPFQKSILDCQTRLAEPVDCVSDDRGDWDAGRDAEAAAAAAAGHRYIDSEPWFCVEGLCPSFIGDELVKRDLVHLTPRYAERIADDLRPIFAP